MLLALENVPLLYGGANLTDIERITCLLAPPMSPEEITRRPDLLARAEVIFTGWGPPVMDEPFLATAPRLKVVFFAGGTIKSWVTDAVWDRELVVTSAHAANAIPVAEYTVAATLFALKRGWHYIARQQRENAYSLPHLEASGTYDATIGLIGLGACGRLVLKRLQPFDVRVIAHDPFVSTAEAAQLGVALVELDEVFHRSHVVSLHAPYLDSTEGMIRGTHFESMKRGATFINTARGGLVREAELTAALLRRPDLTAVIDVFDPEPPSSDHPLLRMPNVIVTPHIAGSQGKECLRLGRLMIEEFERWRAGETLLCQITRESAKRLA